jgi:uncharacterized cupin superfamily protein
MAVRKTVKKPVLQNPQSVPAPRGATIYPPPFNKMVAGRTRRRIGDALGLTSFGVNLTTLEPGAYSSARHWHALEDEFVYVVEGEVVLITDAGETVLRAGMAAGFPAGSPDGHQLVNRGNRPATVLEVGDRRPGEQVTYPDIDLHLRWTPIVTHKDGRPYPAPRKRR